MLTWLAYAAVAWVILRNRNRYYGWMKYLSITTDIFLLHLGMVGSLYNHSGIYEVYRNPMIWVVIAAFNVMAGLRYSVGASLYSAFLTVVFGAGLLLYVGFRPATVWVDSSNYIGDGLNLGDCVQASVFVAVPAVFAAVIAKNSRRLILQAAEESLARADVERDRDRLAKYFSKDIVDVVLNDPDSIGLGGRRMEATVMFADIRNFTALSSTMEPVEK